MHKNFERSLGFYLGIAALCAVMFFSYSYTTHAPQRQAEGGQWVGHTREVIAQLNLLEGHIYKAALAQRDGSASALAQSRQQLNDSIDALDKLTADNPVQQQHIDELRLLIPEAIHNPTRCVQQLDSMRQEEEQLLLTRQHLWQKALAFSLRTMKASQLLLFIAILCAYQFMYRELAKRRRAINLGREEANRLHSIVALQNAVTTESLDIHSMMARVVEQTRQLVKADGSVIERLEKDEMVYDVASGSGTPFIGMRILVKGSFSGKSVMENAILKCDDSETDPNVDRAACKRVGVRSMVVVPLLRKGEPFGVLKVFSSNRAAFSDTDVNTMEIIAALLSARINDATVFTTMSEVNRELASQKEELLFTNAQLGELAATDGLTGLRNHRHFMEKLSEETKRSRRYKSTFSLILVDVDHFKKFNDSFGHVAGDAVLKKVASLLKKGARDTDMVARHGGEEFSLILPDTPLSGAAIIADRLRTAIAESDWDRRAITISVGVSSFHSTEVKELLESADKALYAAKDGGRNCVRLFQHETGELITA